MDISALIYAVGATGIFPSRAFIPAFVTALLLRFGAYLPFVNGVGLIPSQPVQCWFTSDTALVILGLLAVLEMLANKHSDIRQGLELVDHWAKPVIGGLTTLGVLSATDAKTLHAVQQAGLGGQDMLVFITAAGICVVGSFRRAFYEFLTDIDADDSLGFQHFLSWLEDAWVLGAMLLLFLLPLLSAVLIGLAMGVLYCMQRGLQGQEEKKRVPCAGCGTLIYPCAVSCPACKAWVNAPCDVGFFGQSKPGTAGRALDVHRLRLTEKKRCPVCATRLRERRPDQTCTACGARVLADAAAVTAYDQFIRRRAPQVLLLSFLASLIPGLGAIPGVLYYRTQWVAPYRRFVPPFRSLFTRGLVLSACFLLLLVQWVPLVGAVSLPLMALINHVFYRRAFRRAADGA